MLQLRLDIAGAPASSLSSLLSHSAAMETLFETPPPDPASAARHSITGKAQGAVWLLIAASVPALINWAGRAGPGYDYLCFRGQWQMADPGTPRMFAVGWHGKRVRKPSPPSPSRATGGQHTFSAANMVFLD